MQASDLTRDPASTASLTNVKESIFDINCAESAQKFETAKSRFRLRGENCADIKTEITSTQIRNKSNGYVATVFHKAPNAFTTDFINLSAGENQINIVFETAAGTIEKNLTVVRK